MPGLTDGRPPAIRTDGLTAQFGDLVAVDNLTLEVPPGAIFGFLGPNGAGKTTTIRLLLGLVRPARGRAEVAGCDVATRSDDVRRRCGVLLEHAGLYERLSAAENLRFFGRLWRMPAEQLEARIVTLLTHFELADRRDEPVGTWSRGMKQKVALARALLHEPEVLFLDEPTAGLDPTAAVVLRNDLDHLAASERVTVFITTHNLDEAARLCDTVGVIRSGRLIAFGTPDELRAGAGAPTYVVTGTGLDRGEDAVKAVPGLESVVGDGTRLEIRLASGIRPAPVVRALVEAGAEVDEVVAQSASLEDAFLRLLEVQA